MLCVERTLSDGMRAGMATGLGVATVHLTYGVVAFLGGMTLFGGPESAHLLNLASGLVLLYFAARLWRRELVMAGPGTVAPGFARAYGFAICFGFLNPVTPALATAALTAFASHLSTPGGLLPVGVFIGSLSWWLALAIGVSLIKHRLNMGMITLANRGAGLMLAMLGFLMLARGVI